MLLPSLGIQFGNKQQDFGYFFAFVNPICAANKGTANVFICGANRNCGRFVRIFAYPDNKITIFANRIL